MRSLRARLLVLYVVAVVLVTTVVTVVGIQNATQQVREALTTEQEESARSLDLNLQIVLESVNRSVATAAGLILQTDLVPHLNEETIVPLLDAMVAQTAAVDAAVLLDEDGNPLLARPSGHPAQSTSMGHVTAFGSPEPDDVAFTLKGVTGQPVWIRKIAPAGEASEPHYLAAYVSLNHLRSVLLYHGVPETEVFLLDAQGLLVTSTGAPSDEYERVRGLDVQVRTKGGAETTDGLYFWMPSVQGSGFLVFSSSKDKLLANQWSIVLQSVLLAAALAMVAISLGAWAARQVTQPLAKLESVARRMGRGDLHVQARTHGPSEVKNLANALNHMAADLGKERQGLIELKDKLEVLVDERTVQLVEKRRAMENFFYGVSHDIKAPIIAITNLTELVQEELNSTELDRDSMAATVCHITDSGRQLKSLVDELLLFAQSEGLKPVHRLTNLDEIVDGVIKIQKPHADKKGVKLVVSGPSLPVNTDQDQVQRVLANLVGNALNHMPEGRRGTVVVNWEVEQGLLGLTVQDDGAGIPTSVQESLFQPFVREGQRDGHGGFGLGLSIVKGICEALNIDIRLELPETGGTRWRLVFPRTTLPTQLVRT